ncbi:EpsG family protein [Rahnella aquatilis]|uniref:EpsG family protein n=1 Tax=Rahnella aquatilis TaxID=34038 RepID=UPI003652780C
MLIYIILLLVLVINCCFENNKKIFYSSIFILFIVAVLRGDDVDRDYKTYISIYEYLINGDSYTIEPTFILFTFISHAITGTPFLIFVIYASLALYYKAKYIRYFSPYICLSLLLYYSNFYFVHELTQIRIGVASAIGFFSLKYLIEGRKNKFIAYVLIATLFHFSMIVLLVSLLFDKNKISNNFISSAFILIVISYSLIILNVSPLDLLRYVPVSVIQEKLAIYKYQTANGMVEAVNVISALQLIRIGAIILIFCNAKKFDNNNSMVLLCKLYSLSPICLALLSSLPAFAIRISELFSVADIVVLPILASYCKQKNVARFAVVVLSVLVLFMNLYHNEIVKGYHI